MYWKYDIFISYRREGGFDTAKHLYDLLTRDGFKVSFDIDTLRNGDFDESLLQRIDECKDFILIVDKNAFDRTLDPSFDPKKDWLRQELAYALKKKKNIIPVFLNGVKGFPDKLPVDVRDVYMKNGPEYNRYYFNDFYKTLKKRFITSYSKITVFTWLSLAVLICGGLIWFLSVFNNSQSSETSPDIENLDGIDSVSEGNDGNDSVSEGNKEDDTHYPSNLDTHKLFVKGLKNGIVYNPQSDYENKGISYTYKDGRVIDILLRSENAGMIFTAKDEGGFQQVLNFDFDKIGYSEEGFEYTDNEYLIGQHDLNGDGIDELVLAVRTTGGKYDPDGAGIAINFFNPNYGKWDFMAKFSSWINYQDPVAKLINNNVFVHWMRYDEKYTFNGKEFVIDEDFSGDVFTDADLN